MWDLHLSAAALLVVSAVAFLVGVRVARHWPQGPVAFVALSVVAGLLVFVLRFHGTLRIAQWVPVSGAIILGNWIPVGGALLAGLTLGQPGSTPGSKRSLTAMILLVSVYSVACCFQGRLTAGDGPVGHVVAGTQSRRSSCGACCAAALLEHHGVAASEEEMIELCLTSHRGCPALGLYRGLKLKTAGTKWDVEVVTGPFEKLIRTRGPLVLRVWGSNAEPIDFTTSSPPRTQKYEHAVLLLGIDDGCARVYDPAVPATRLIPWKLSRLREVWCGEALRLVPVRRKPGL